MYISEPICNSCGHRLVPAQDNMPWVHGFEISREIVFGCAIYRRFRDLKLTLPEPFRM